MIHVHVHNTAKYALYSNDPYEYNAVTKATTITTTNFKTNNWSYSGDFRGGKFSCKHITELIHGFIIRATQVRAFLSAHTRQIFEHVVFMDSLHREKREN